MPVLSTERLVLHPVTEGDVGALHSHWTLPEVRRYLWDDEVISREQVEDVVRRSGALFDGERAGLWTLRLRGSSQLVGCSGFWYFHDPPQREIIFSVSPTHWKRGLAYEAASALLRYVFDQLQWPIVQGSANTPNHASLSLMRRLGMQQVQDRPGRSGPTSVFRLTSEEWAAMHARDDASPPARGGSVRTGSDR